MRRRWGGGPLCNGIAESRPENPHHGGGHDEASGGDALEDDEGRGVVIETDRYILNDQTLAVNKRFGMTACNGPTDICFIVQYHDEIVHFSRYCNGLELSYPWILLDNLVRGLTRLSQEKKRYNKIDRERKISIFSLSYPLPNINQSIHYVWMSLLMRANQGTLPWFGLVCCMHIPCLSCLQQGSKAVTVLL
jgi:hypothetical protein